MARVLHNWPAIQAQHDAGFGFVACQRKFGFSHTAWVKAIKRGSLRSSEREFNDRRRRYNWSAVQRYYDEGNSFRECQAYFGFCSASWTKAVRRSEIKPRNLAKGLLVVLTSRSSAAIKKRKLVREGHFFQRCSACGISDWLGKPLAIQLDHINGNHDDWSLSNLRMLCPNCHSQTQTFAGRNVRLKSLLRGEAKSV